MSPAIGIISAGDGNPYGHPKVDLLERMANANVRILRTDRDGAIPVMTDGTRLEIICFVTCSDAAEMAVSPGADVPDHQQRGKQQ